MKDYYYILGIKKEASTDDIKKAYRKLSLKFHPDKNDGDDFFTERFKEIQEAYETLADAKKRINYDGQFSNNKQNGTANNGYNFDPIIDFFKVNKSAFEFDEEITFSWKTINSDKVTIKPFGIVQPIGQKTYRIKDFKNSVLSFDLIAENTNIGRQTKQSLKLSNRTYQELYSHFRHIIEAERKTRTNKNGSNSKDKTNNDKPIGLFQTDKGEIKVELNFEGAIPAMNNRVYQNNTLAKDGKYKLGFMNYLIIRGGTIIDMTLF